MNLFGKDFIRKVVKEVRVDTTVQEKNITFPTDRKLTEKVIGHCKRIAKKKKEDIKLARTYQREIKKLKRQLQCECRLEIEGLISHLKHDHRMLRNYLSGTAGDKINTLLAAAAYNMKN